MEEDYVNPFVVVTITKDEYKQMYSYLDNMRVERELNKYTESANKIAALLKKLDEGLTE